MFTDAILIKLFRDVIINNNAYLAVNIGNNCKMPEFITNTI